MGEPLPLIIAIFFFGINGIIITDEHLKSSG